MRKRSLTELIVPIIITLVWTIALHSAVIPVVLGDTVSDSQSIALKDAITRQFEAPISIWAGFETDFHIGFIIEGTVTFTGSADTQMLTIDSLPGFDVNSEYSIHLGEVGTYKITESLTLSIQIDNVFLGSYLVPLISKEFEWHYENMIAEEKTYTLSSRVTNLATQFRSDQLEAIPVDQKTFTVTVEQEIPDGTIVDYTIEYSADWARESSIAGTDTDAQLNQPPVLDSIPDSEVEIGQDLQIPLAATDPDEGDTLEYSAVGDPMGLGAQLDGNVFTWRPAEGLQVGDYWVTFTVRDTAGESDEQTVKIGVYLQEDESFSDDGQPGDGSQEQDNGDGGPTGPNAHVNLKLDEDSVKFRGVIPPFPAGDPEVLFQLLQNLELEGEFNGIDYTLKVEITDLAIGEDGVSGTLTLNPYVSSGDTEIAEPNLVCTFELTTKGDKFRLEIEGEGLLFEDLKIKVIGSVSDDGMVSAPVVHVDIKYAEGILELVNLIPFEAIISAFDLSSFPTEIVLPPGSFAGIEYYAELSLYDLRDKINENKNKTQIKADADVGILLMINGFELQDLLKSRFDLKLMKKKFKLALNGNGKVLKMNLRIDGDVTDDGMITSPSVKLELLYKKEGMPRGSLAPKGEVPEISEEELEAEEIEEALEDVREKLDELLEDIEEAGIEVTQEKVDNLNASLEGAQAALEQGNLEEAARLVEEAEELLVDLEQEAASAAAIAAENSALTAETDALEADADASEAAGKPAREAQKLARKAASAAKKAAQKAEKAAKEAQLAAEKAVEAADEASLLAAKKAKEAAEKANEAAEKAHQAAKRAGKEAADLNDDGKTNIFDLIAVIRAFGKRFASLEDEGAITDINGDGFVNIVDLVLAAQATIDGVLIPPVEEDEAAAAPSRNADANVQLKINQSKSNAFSNMIRIDLMADGIQDLYAFQFDLPFDPNVLEVVKVEEGSLLGSDGVDTYWYSPEIDARSGKAISATCTRVASEGISEGGVLAVVTFKVKGDDWASAALLKAGILKVSDAKGNLLESRLEVKRLNFAKILVPRSSRLLQNYPNPFNPETWIPYELATDSSLTIRVYNARGQLVRQLDLGNQKAGSYISRGGAAYWDGRNEAGEQVASGVYFYHIQAGSFSATRKMVVTK